MLQLTTRILLFAACAVLLPGSLPARDTGSQTTAHHLPDSRPSLDLSGPWEFQLDPADEGRAGKWFEPDRPFERHIQVPGAWNAQGAEYPSKEMLRAFEKTQLNGANVVAGPEREDEKLFHAYPGPAWYRKTVDVPAAWKDKITWLVLHGVHREADVWVNGQFAGSHRSYLVPARLDVSKFALPGKPMTITIRVDARRNAQRDPLMGCVDTCDFLYITWGGLYRTVTLEATPRAWIDDVFVAPQLARHSADVRVKIAGQPAGKLELSTEIRDAAGELVDSSRRPAEADGSESEWQATLPNAKLWSPKTPHLYSADLRLLLDGEPIDSRAVRFGMREFKVSGRQFLLNGKPVFLRGYGDDSIFPNTICPPQDRNEYRKRLALARDYGFNYVRHHSWCPPKEYLDVADELGMMVQAEFPFAYRSYIPATPELWESATKQWQEMIRQNRNHPSIVTWCMGNELYDTPHHEAEWYRLAKALDPTRVIIDTDGCTFGDKHRPTLDFLVVPFDEGNLIGFQDRKYDLPGDVGKPVVGHEMGYFVTLHELSQLDLFRSGVRPYWLYDTQRLVAEKGVLDHYPEWLAASYRLQSVCLKTNLEAARRSSLAGGHVWLFQDYPNCAEGVVDMFFRPKGISAQEFRHFNAPTVLLLDAPRRSWQAGEQAELKLLASRYEDEPASDAVLRWELRAADAVLTSGIRRRLQVGNDGNQELLTLALAMPDRGKAERLSLWTQLSDGNGETENSWNLWTFPRPRLSEAARKVRFTTATASLMKAFPESALPTDGHPIPADTDLLITHRLGPDVAAYLQAGGRVLLTEPEPAFPVERTNYRLSSWDGGGPSGTIVDTTHPALREMPSEGWCDLHFYPLIQGSKTVFLDRLSARPSPIVRCIDRPNRLAERAYLFEAAVGEGKLLVSGFNFSGAIESGDPAAAFLLERLISYALGPEFQPETLLPRAAATTP